MSARVDGAWSVSGIRLPAVWWGWMACCLLACAPSADSGSAGLQVRGSAFWPVLVAGEEAQLIPLGDGQHVWVLEQGRISVVDREGRRTPREGSWLPSGARALELVQTRQPGLAWVLASAAGEQQAEIADRLFLVDARPGFQDARTVLESGRLVRVPEQRFSSPLDVVPDASVFEAEAPRAHLWVVLQSPGPATLAAIDSQGRRVLGLPLDTLGTRGDAEAVSRWRVVPVDGGPRAWLRFTHGLVLLDPEAPGAMRGPLLPGAQPLWVVPGPDGARAWVVTDRRTAGSTRMRGHLYAVDALAPRGRQVERLLEGLEVRQVVRVEGSPHLWVAGSLLPEEGSRGGVSLVDLRGREQLASGPLFQGQEVTLAATRAGRMWLLAREGGAALVDARGQPLAMHAEAMPPRPPGGRSILLTSPAGAGDELLVWGEHVFHLRVKEGSVQATPLLEEKAPLLLGPEPGGRGAWLQDLSDDKVYFVSLRDESYLEAHHVLTPMSEALVLPAGDGEHGWIQSTAASFAYVPRSRVGATLSLEGGTLKVTEGSHARAEGQLHIRARLRGAGADLDWPGRERAPGAGGVLEVTLREASRQGPVASLRRSFSPGSPEPRLDWYHVGAMPGAQPYLVSFRYQDRLGTDTWLEVRGARFTAPLREQVWFRTAVACLVATLVFLAPVVLLPNTHLAHRWLPLVSWGGNVVVGSGAAFTRVAQELRIHLPAFVGVLVAEMVLCMVAGALSPVVFRQLASTRPFRWLVPLAFSLTPVRRRLFADYVAALRRRLESQRLQANDERFVSLPVDLREGGTNGPGAPAASEAAPPEQRLSDALTLLVPGQRANALIEAPGGQGKSALLREVLARMLLHFEKEPASPLPLLCDLRSAQLEEAARRALGAEGLPADVQQLMMERGDIILVVDGLSESALAPDAVQEFIQGRWGRSVRLLLTTRTHPGFRRAVEGSERWLHAHPRRLDAQTLDRFIQVYASGGGGMLRADLLAACQGPDGTYLPILVRLALLFGEGVGGSVADLYEAAFRGLLRRQGTVHGEEDTELLVWTRELCLRTYWVNGIRSLRYRNAPEQVQMEKLLKAGVLVPDDPRALPGQPPSQVRFFHDSMQSYLTAVGLFARVYEQPTWEVLWRAAASPLFTHVRAGPSRGTGSELFQMCLWVFGPRERLLEELRRQLLGWAHVYDDALTKRDIVSGLSEPLQGRLRERMHASPDLSPGRLLALATGLCAGDVGCLGSLYQRLAGVLWPLKEEEAEAGEHAASVQPAPPG